MIIKTYHVKHKRKKEFEPLLKKAQQVANYAVNNKSKYPSSKDVKNIDLPSIIKNQILRKYGRGSIKKASNVNLIIPNMVTKTTKKNYETIIYKDEWINIKPLQIEFRWNPGIPFKDIKLIEINEEKFMITITMDSKNALKENDLNNYLGIDLNCGIGRHIAVCANLENNQVINLGKNGPNIRKKYWNKRKKQKIKNNKEKRIMKDLDHKISRKIVDYALKNKLKIILEDLKNIRNKSKKGTGSKGKNRVVNSWSYYRLQFFIEYKAKEYNIPVIKIEPNYTSQDCSYCSVIGKRNQESFICNNKKCCSYKKIRNSDVNASFNIAKRAKLIN